SSARESASNRCVFVVSSLAGIVLKLPRVSARAKASAATRDAKCPVVKEAAGQNGGSAPEPDLPGDGVGGALGLHGLEQIAAEYRLMLAAMHLTPIGDLAEVEPGLEQMGERSHAKADTAAP